MQAVPEAVPCNPVPSACICASDGSIAFHLASAYTCTKHSMPGTAMACCWAVTRQRGQHASGEINKVVHTVALNNSCIGPVLHQIVLPHSFAQASASSGSASAFLVANSSFHSSSRSGCTFEPQSSRAGVAAVCWSCNESAAGVIPSSPSLL